MNEPGFVFTEMVNWPQEERGMNTNCSAIGKHVVKWYQRGETRVKRRDLREF